MRGNTWTTRGFTLIELLVSLAIFSVVSIIMYSTFTTITKATGKVNETQTLSDKAQRVVSFIEEDLRLVGFVVGPDAQVPYCSAVTTPVLSITTPGVFPNDQYDSLTFLTAIPIPVKDTSSCLTSQKDCSPNPDVITSAGVPRPDYYLTNRCNAIAGSPTTPNFTLLVDAASSCYDEIVPASAVGSADNAKAMVTFGALRMTTTQVSGSGNTPQSFYTVRTVGTTLTLFESLLQTIPDNSTVYGVRRYRYDVDPTAGARTLRRVASKTDCSDDPVSLLENSSTFGGGIDALKFEFTYLDPINKNWAILTTLPPSNSYNFTDLKYITIWAVVRSDKITPGYTDTNTYTMGTGAATLPNLANPAPYAYTPPAGTARSFRRVLVHKSVEVKNLAPIY